MRDEIRQFFLDPNEPEKLETALQIEAHLQGVKRFLFQTFWEQVHDELKQLMKKNGHDQLWKVYLSADIFENEHTSLEIMWRDSDSPRRFTLCVESITKKSAVHYGITRGIHGLETSRRDQRDEDLIAELGHKGFRPRFPQSSWVAVRRFGEESELLPTFNIEHNGDLLKLGREMLDEDKSLTEQVYRLIWKLFCDFREPLEDLNRKYPYYEH